MAAPAPSTAELVGELGRLFRAGDREAAFALYHPEVTIEQPPSLPHGGSHRGREGVLTMGEMFARHWDRTIDDARLWDAGDIAVQLTSQTWTSKATGRSATVDVVELFSSRDGQVDRIQVFPQDTHRLLATLDGVRPPATDTTKG